MTQTIFITGATSGFGLVTAKRFAREGWKVAATYSRDEMVSALRDVPNVSAYKLDVANEDQVAEVAARVMAELGLPDVIVNNAGYCLVGSLAGSLMEQIRRHFDVNVFGLIAVTKAFLTHLRHAGAA